jgi:hypothetical protein
VASAGGCLSTSTTLRTGSESANSDTVVQSGKVVVPARSFQDVYYDVPYATIPKLEISDTWSRCVLATQSPTRFRVSNSSHSDVTVEWKARGIKAPPAPPPVVRAPQLRSPSPAPIPAPPSIQPASASVPAPENGLPPAPVPITAGR